MRSRSNRQPGIASRRATCRPSSSPDSGSGGGGKSTVAPASPASSVRQRGLACGLELVARHPPWQLVAVGELDADGEPELRVLDHAVEVPAWLDLVARLVVARALVGLDLLATPAGGVTDEVGARAEV